MAGRRFGRIETATFERRLTRHSYLRGEVTKVTNVCGAETNEIAYAYDALQCPVSRNADTFAYNRRGEMASATVESDAVTHELRRT